MANEMLKSLLKEYERKRSIAEENLEKKKEKVYKDIPRLEKIEEEINKYSIYVAKEALKGNKISEEEVKENITKLKNEKEEILNKKKIELKPQYECEDCKDTGYILNQDYSRTMCHCLKQKILDNLYNKSNIANLDKENFDTFNTNLFSDEIDPKEGISPRENIEYIKRKCIYFVENFDNSECKNLLFTGNIGTGKTFMTNCIASELLKKGKNVLYQTAPVLLETVIDNKMDKNKTEEQKEFYKNVLECDLLIIDDLGTEFFNRMTIAEVFTILNTRILNPTNTKTIISTNLNIKEIFQNYEERLGSRIARFYDIYHFFGDDLRLKK